MKLGKDLSNGKRPALQPIPALWWMLGAVTAVVVTASVVTTLLLILADHSTPGPTLVSARLEAVRTGLAAGAGAGAAVGLMLAFRRQHHQEIATVLTDLDATERRVTELYGRATEQLGSDKAPVRLAGLYALERLGQSNQNHRQTIINVICAYLRMPFDPPPRASQHFQYLSDKSSTADSDQKEDAREDLTSQISLGCYEELQVRLTAQRILAEHLNPRIADIDMSDSSIDNNVLSTRFWDGIRIDLTGVTLIDFRISQCRLTGATFRRAIFIGNAGFSFATFNGLANFNEVTFHGAAHFRGARFEGQTVFANTTFDGDGVSSVDFDQATFGWLTNFRSATFSKVAWFRDSTFNGDVLFDKARFASAYFQGTTFSGKPKGSDIPRGIASFRGATFSSDVNFSDATITHAYNDTNLGIWPAGWGVERGASGKGRITRHSPETLTLKRQAKAAEEGDPSS